MKLRSSAVTTLFALSLFSITALASDHGTGGTSPDAAYHALQEGNSRFVEGKPSHAKEDVARRKELASGQKPSAIILSCSDSRVPPELVFDKGLGELFTVRVAGNVLGAATVASMEYAVEHLGAKLIVVMGHESCGAVKAALETPPGKSAGSFDLDALISSIQPGIAGVDRSIANTDKKIRKPVMMNVDAVSERLLKRSKIISRAVASGDVKLVRGIYSLETGKVDFWADGAKAEASHSEAPHAEAHH